MPVQEKGKVVAVGRFGAVTSESLLSAGEIVEQFNANGSIDLSFRTNGQITLSLPTGATAILTDRLNVGLAIQSNGALGIASDRLRPSSDDSDGFVAQVTPAGQPDSNLAIIGEILHTGKSFVTMPAVQPNSSIIAAVASASGCCSPYG